MTRWQATLVLVALGLVGVTPVSSQCPAYGYDSGCGTVITITATNGVQIVQTGQGPYEGSDDTLVGIVNNSNVPISSIVLTSPNNIFGFDGDGIDTYGAPGNAMDTTGYGGPNSYFTNINPSQTSGTVNFVTPLAPQGGTTYFSLENALSSTPPCSDIVKNSVSTPALSGDRSQTISATFTPNFSYNVAQAAVYCGFVDFDWVQTIVLQPDPNRFFAQNLAVVASTGTVNGTTIPIRLGGAFKPGKAVPYKITGADAPFNDPPQGGGYTYQGGATPDYSYPFYCNVLGDTVCTKTFTTLSMMDTPTNSCLPDAMGNPSSNYSMNPTVRAQCGNKVAPIGSHTAFTTHLAGVKPDGTAKDLGIGFAWTSNNNGTAGGINTTKTASPGDPNSGTGGVTVVATNGTTNYQYSSFGVTGINGATLPTQSTLSPDQVSVTASGLAYSRVQKAFVGTVTVTNLSDSVISGPIEVVMTFLPPSVALNASAGTFGGFPYIASPNDLPAGESVTLNVSFANTGSSPINFNPVAYSGSFE
jgi:hypothetical protein